MTLPYNPIFARLEALAACLCAEIQDPANEVPDVCFCGVIPGDAVAAQYAGNCNSKCGMAWVRLTSIYPSNAVGVPVTVPVKCDSGIGFGVEVGILRCMSVGDDRGNLPPASVQTAAAELQMADALLIRRAVVCCGAIDAGTVVLGNYLPIGPQGGLVGGIWPIQMAV